MVCLPERVGFRGERPVRVRLRRVRGGGEVDRLVRRRAVDDEFAVGDGDRLHLVERDRRILPFHHKLSRCPGDIDRPFRRMRAGGEGRRGECEREQGESHGVLRIIGDNPTACRPAAPDQVEPRPRRGRGVDDGGGARVPGAPCGLRLIPRFGSPVSSRRRHNSGCVSRPTGTCIKRWLGPPRCPDNKRRQERKRRAQEMSARSRAGCRGAACQVPCRGAKGKGAIMGR